MRRAWRAPFVGVAFLSLAYGVWLGLMRLGWILPLPRPDQLILHGPLMIGGFLGTLIGLERAVGLGRPWAYAAPLSSAAGALVLGFGPPATLGPLLIAVASVIVTVVFITIVRRQPTLFATTMLAATIAWLIGNALWCAGYAIYRVVFWWVAFLVLTIAGERLELNRVRRPTRTATVAFVSTVATILIGIGSLSSAATAGVRVTGLGFVALAGWLLVYDVARRTIDDRGLTRYIAVCLLSGYLWLAVAGAIALVMAPVEPGSAYDATLHAVFLGFVVSMIFGHAPVIMPAILGRPLRYTPAFYVHLALLHASLALRIAGDLVDSWARLRAWGGLLNAAALAAFAAATAAALAAGRQRSAGFPATR